MGPLVPDFITDEFNLIAAFIIGIAFGYILEQAGFSSSKRLAGVFYGYDFTVLRVFFTAGVTAVVGLLILAQFGFIDMDFVYINPLWLYPAIAGGVIMGVGFILGGYCPGTSICAAAIGKKDAMLFVLGGIAGVFLFAEMYPLLKDFYEGSFMGPVKIYESLSITQGLFIVILIPIAVAAFYFTTKIEKKVNKEADSAGFTFYKHASFAALLILVTFVLAVIPGRKESLLAKAKSEAATENFSYVTADELAFHLANENKRMQIIMITRDGKGDSLILPGSIKMGFKEITTKAGGLMIQGKHVKKILAGADEQSEKEFYTLMKSLGYTNIALLQGGIDTFKRKILEYEGIDAIRETDEVLADFRIDAGRKIHAMILQASAAPVKKVSVKKIKGGC